MDITNEIINETMYVKLVGEISLEDREKLESEFKKIVQILEKKDIKKLKADMTSVEYIDSIGISYFIRLNKDMKVLGIEFGFVNMTKNVRKIFGMLNIESLFKFYD